MKLPANKPNFSCFNFASFMPSKIIFSLIVSFLLWSCGGDEPPVEDGAELGSAETESTNEVSNLTSKMHQHPNHLSKSKKIPNRVRFLIPMVYFCLSMKIMMGKWRWLK